MALSVLFQWFVFCEFLVHDAKLQSYSHKVGNHTVLRLA